MKTISLLKGFMHSIFCKSSFIFKCILTCGLLYLIFQIFFFSFFTVAGPSMQPELEPGDVIMVWKPIIGARLFNIFDAINDRPYNIHRLYGNRKIRRNDVLVFNFPYAKWNKWDNMKLNLLKYYVKRCIAIPGDTINIKDGFYHIKGQNIMLGNIIMQHSLHNMYQIRSMKNDYYYTLPYDSAYNWNVLNFGPMYIPKRGDYIDMNRENYILYKRLIEWETNKNLMYIKGHIMLGGILINRYKFNNNYYFMGGDNVPFSIDSRYWGLIPESFIVGKASLIVKSVNSINQEINWKRFLKEIQ